MRIGLAIEHFEPERGGAEIWTLQFVRQLLSRGHEVHVVSQTFSREVSALPLVTHRLGRFVSRIRRAQAFERRLRSLNLDVVHDMGAGWYCDVFHSHDGSRMAQWDRKLVGLSGIMRPWKRLLVRWSPRYAAFRKLMARQFHAPDRLFLALSRMVADDYQRYHHVPEEQIRIIHNGVDVERFDPARSRLLREPIRRQWGLGDDELVLLFVGHDFFRTGLATAILALGRLAGDAPVRLVVVGGSRWRPYARLAEQCGVADRLTFVGAVGDPLPYYGAADVCVLPTLYDPCSLVVLEAAACGLPVVTTRQNGAGELLTDGCDGFVLPDPTDADALAGRIGLLLDGDCRRRMSAAARTLALQNTLSHNVDRFEALYREVARSGRTPHAAAGSSPRTSRVAV